jgi:hypothetical protein
MEGQGLSQSSINGALRDNPQATCCSRKNRRDQAKEDTQVEKQQRHVARMSRHLNTEASSIVPSSAPGSQGHAESSNKPEPLFPNMEPAVLSHAPVSEEDMITEALMQVYQNNNGIPPLLLRSEASHLLAAVFLVFDAQLRSAAASPVQKASADFSKVFMPGVGLVRDADGVRMKEVWFCDCSVETSAIQHSMEALHNLPGECDHLHNAQCWHVRYCQHALALQGLTDIRAFIQQAPCSSPQDEGESLTVVLLLM